MGSSVATIGQSLGISSKKQTKQIEEENWFKPWISKQKLPQHTLGDCITNKKGEIFFVCFRPIIIYKYNQKKDEWTELYSNLDLIEYQCKLIIDDKYNELYIFSNFKCFHTFNLNNHEFIQNATYKFLS